MSPLTYCFALHRNVVTTLSVRVNDDYSLSGIPLDTVTRDPSAKNADAGSADSTSENSAP